MLLRRMSPPVCGARWRREGHLPAVAEPDRTVPAVAEPAPGPREPAHATRGEVARGRRNPRRTQQAHGGDADLQEHRHAARPAGRPRRAEEGARGAQGDAYDPSQIAAEAGESSLRAV